jgi:3-oxoacyl-[acyl-carrier protein] reductase
LEGKTAIVTGAARGIGRATVAALLKAGANVAACDLDGLDELEASFGEHGKKCLPRVCDVSDEQSVKLAIQGSRETFGFIDIVVNNAGIMLEKGLIETSIEEFDRIVDVNLKGVFLVGREAIRAMREDDRPGRVINIASELALLGREKSSLYCATKGAIISLTRSWAREFAPDILVNSVAPGPVDTELLGLKSMSPEQAQRELNNPLERVGKPEEIADAIVFLSGPGSTFVTGQTIGVNGGAVMY